MANAFSKEEVVLFEQLLEKFDADNMTAKQVAKFRPSDTDSERTNDRFWRPVPYISTTVDGIDVSAAFQDITQLSVPAEADIIANVPWKLSALELRDPLQRERKSDSGAQALSARVNREIANLVGNTGSLVVTSTGAASGYSDIAAAEVRMLNEEIDLDVPRTYMFNGNDYKLTAADLANRETMLGKPNAAYSRSFVGPVAGFDTFRTSFQKTLAGSSASTTVNGAQSHVPVATTANAINGGESNVDNRFFDLTVTASAGFAVGDCITIASCTAVSMINKESLNELRVFRVTAVPDGTTLTITPPPVDATGSNQSEKEYGNVGDVAANASAIAVVNHNNAKVNTFWSNDSIEIYEARFAMPDEDMAGISTMRGSTDSGIEILFAKSGEIDDLTAKYRLTMNFGVTNLQPQMNGIQLFSQTP